MQYFVRFILSNFFRFLSYIYIYISKVGEGNTKAPFSIYITPKCRGGRYSFPGMLHFTLDTYFVMLIVKQGGIKNHFLSLWYDSTCRRLTKAWTAIDQLVIIWKSDLTDKMKRSCFQAAVVSILLYGCTIWTLTKRLEKKLDGNYTRMLRAILNKSRR